MSADSRCPSESRLETTSDLSISQQKLAQPKLKKTWSDTQREKMFTLPPVPSIGKFKYDPWPEHPLMKYFGKQEKQKLDDQVIIRHGKKIKSYVADAVYKKKAAEAAKGDHDHGPVENFLTQDDFVEYLRDSVRSAPVVPMHKLWRKRVVNVRHNL